MKTKDIKRKKGPTKERFRQVFVKGSVNIFIEIGNQEISAGRNVSEWQERVDYAQSPDTNNITFEESGRLNELAHSSETLLDQ